MGQQYYRVPELSTASAMYPRAAPYARKPPQRELQAFTATLLLAFFWTDSEI